MQINFRKEIEGGQEEGREGERSKEEGEGVPVLTVVFLIFGSVLPSGRTP